MTSRKTQLEQEEDQERPYNVSSIPVSSEEKETEIPVNQNEIFTSRAHTEKFFKDLGFSLSAYEFEIYGPSGRQLGVDQGQKLFFANVTIEDEPITQQITTMKRVKAWEYYKNDKNRYQKRVKEYLVYSASLSGVDRFGNEIKTRITNGLAWEPDVKVRVSYDEYHKARYDYYFDHLRDHYYIPYSAKTVNDLIANTKSNKDNIRYYCEVGSDPNSNTTRFRCDQYDFEQFTSCSFADLEKIAFQPNTKWSDAKPKKVWTG